MCWLDFLGLGLISNSKLCGKKLAVWCHHCVATFFRVNATISQRRFGMIALRWLQSDERNVLQVLCEFPPPLLLGRGRPAHPDGGDVAVAAVPRQRRSDHPALLATLPLHQHVALQQAGDGH